MTSHHPLPRHAATPPSLHESTFGVGELFFSRTDPAGIMQSGNAVFQRVSEYSWDELIGRPHKLIRHPGTPRAVFHLLWQTIKAGRPIGAYVQNKARSGAFYWVYAVVTPIREGYLSVRLKPVSDLVPRIKALYAAHAEMERKSGCTPAESAALLLDEIRGLGFPDYGAFSAAALARELNARADALSRDRDAMTGCLNEVSVLTRSILLLSDATHRSYAALKLAPMNISLEASRAGQAGIPTGVVARNYQMLAGELNDVLTAFVVAANELGESVNKSLFLAGTAALQREMHAVFDGERGGGGSTRAADMAILHEQQGAYFSMASASLDDVARARTAFVRSCTAMGRLVSALEVMRVMGKVEWARVGVSSGHMDALLSQFGAFQTELRDTLRKLDGLNKDLGLLATQALAAAA
ncbi:PAS domain-containing protein [uncultured Alsobacter sp.]|uniref:PAS domain-containing protein n=1 Tax=uncultured Alsobacter sp. TaxID=1748258 RepID=UPI0025F1740F|nr:PAS domain-containing protein [uncultured Alsobacter sp.]